MKIRRRTAVSVVFAISLAVFVKSPMLTAQAIDAATTPAVDAPAAQSAPLPEAPAPARNTPVPPAGSMGRTADVKYYFVVSSLAASTVANAEALVRCDNCTFVPWELHRRGITYGIGIPVNIGVSYLSYRWKKAGHRWWYLPSAVLTAGNAYLAYHWASSIDSEPTTTLPKSKALSLPKIAR
jgi:hypothetical protein